MRSPIHSFLALVAAPVLLVSAYAAPALADCAEACNFVLGSSGISGCTVEFTGGCEAQCTPISLVAECDGSCSADAEASCTGSCGTSCMADCSANPGSFSCSGECTSECSANCSSSCTDSACMSDCDADCTNRCDVQCDATPPSATCDVQCQTACNASCQVSVNIDCHAKCVIDEQGGCTAACQEPAAAIFCNGQFVSVSEATSCVSCLETQGLTLSVTGSVTCADGQCSGSAGVCSVGPAVGSSKDGWGVLGVTGLMVGLGLLASRRRSHRGSSNPSDLS